MTFTTTYREHVLPALDRECFVAGTHVALGLAGFAEAGAAIRGIAHRRGAARLPPHLHDELLDWIDGRLLHHALAAEASYAAIRTAIDRLAAPEGGPECPTMATP